MAAAFSSLTKDNCRLLTALCVAVKYCVADMVAGAQDEDDGSTSSNSSNDRSSTAQRNNVHENDIAVARKLLGAISLLAKLAGYVDKNDMFYSAGRPRLVKHMARNFDGDGRQLFGDEFSKCVDHVKCTQQLASKMVLRYMRAMQIYKRDAAMDAMAELYGSADDIFGDLTNMSIFYRVVISELAVHLAAQCDPTSWHTVTTAVGVRRSMRRRRHHHHHHGYRANCWYGNSSHGRRQPAVAAEVCVPLAKMARMGLCIAWYMIGAMDRRSLRAHLAQLSVEVDQIARTARLAKRCHKRHKRHKRHKHVLPSLQFVAIDENK